LQIVAAGGHGAGDPPGVGDEPGDVARLAAARGAGDDRPSRRTSPSGRAARPNATAPPPSAPRASSSSMPSRLRRTSASSTVSTCENCTGIAVRESGIRPPSGISAAVGLPGRRST
jgi:hypothetical protein